LVEIGENIFPPFLPTEHKPQLACPRGPFNRPKSWSSGNFRSQKLLQKLIVDTVFRFSIKITVGDEIKMTYICFLFVVCFASIRLFAVAANGVSSSELGPPTKPRTARNFKN
jgi:hypothetical protein